MPEPRHVYEILVRAPADRVWEAITDPAYTRRYFHRTAVESSFEPGTGIRYVMADGEVAVEGQVQAVEPGRRLVMTWRALYDPEIAAEPPSRVEWVLAPAGEGGEITRVTLRHLDLGRSPRTSDGVRVGWVEVLEGLKTLVEAGRPPTPAPGDAVAAGVEDVEGA